MLINLNICRFQNISPIKNIDNTTNILTSTSPKVPPIGEGFRVGQMKSA